LLDGNFSWQTEQVIGFDMDAVGETVGPVWPSLSSAGLPPEETPAIAGAATSFFAALVLASQQGWQ
jgi:hypothetical protein